MCRMEMTTLLQAAAAKLPQVALITPNLVSLADSMAILRNFHLAHPEIIKVLLVESADRELVVGGFRSGVRGIFCLSDSNLRFLSKCIHRVAAGQVWADTQQMNYLLELIVEVPSLRVLNSDGRGILTPREEQVVALVAEGLGNREIAHELTLSEHTIKKYLFRIFDKLGISTRVELVLYAVNHGDPLRAQWLTGRRLIPSA
jgi:DNA-binding NarL/FixJ family response regulator